MQRLRIVTTALAVFGVGLLLSFPFWVGSRPGKDATKEERLGYARNLTLYFGVVSVSLLGAAFSAMLLARRIRQQYYDTSIRNLADLVATPIPKPDSEESKDE